MYVMCVKGWNLLTVTNLLSELQGERESEAIVGTLQRCSGLRIGVGNADLITLDLLGCFTLMASFASGPSVGKRECARCPLA